VNKLLKSVTRGQCDARPTVTFPAGTIGHILFGDRSRLHVRKQLAQLVVT